MPIGVAMRGWSSGVTGTIVGHRGVVTMALGSRYKGAPTSARNQNLKQVYPTRRGRAQMAMIGEAERLAHPPSNTQQSLPLDVWPRGQARDHET